MGLILRTTLAVEPGQEEAFDRVARRWVERTRDEVDTLGFHLFVDLFVDAGPSGGGEAIFLEHYRDSAAFSAHAAAVDPELRAALYGTCRFVGLDVYGAVTDEVRGALAKANARFYAHVESR